MALSSFLKSRRKKIEQLVSLLKDEFDYAAVLGSDVRANVIQSTKNLNRIQEGSDLQRGFVIKLNKGASFLEYSFDDIKNPQKLAEEIRKMFANTSIFNDEMINISHLDNEEINKDFIRRNDFNNYDNETLFNEVAKIKDDIAKMDEHLLNVICNLQMVETSKIFVSKTKNMSQNYSWVNGMLMAIYQGDNEKVVNVREMAYSNKIKDVLAKLPTLKERLIEKAKHLVLAKPITPGVYDIITHPSISGLIAHEAFGHGVEMDQFTKHRALGEKYVGDYVASPLVNMKDGANSAFSVASYFFDDDGILAGDTDIIKDGILVTGISDLVSATRLGTKPTGNGRRESYKRKVYSRMTNTFFLPGTSKLEDMIKSVKHGYMLFETNNGMEDPKNWGIQCACEYGIEIVDGKLTDNYVSPVVISGYVPDLLKSISMVSKDLEVIGSGSCGKGYKEWVRVSDGGPYLKGRVKLS